MTLFLVNVKNLIDLVKILTKFLSFLMLLYLVLWIGVLVYFNFAERHKGLLETNLTSIFDRDVSIESVRTAWSGVSPTIQISGFSVAGDTAEQSVLAFESMSAKFSIVSIFRFWPMLTELAVERPQLEIVSLPNNRLQIAGIELRTNSDVGINPQRLISWILNHKQAVWHDGEVVWRHRNGETQRYADISFIYERKNEERSISASMQTEQGPFAFSATTRGDILAAKNWDASFEVLGNQGQQLFAPEDLLLSVEKGLGRFQLKALNINRIRDFLLLTGLGESAKWVLDSQLSGVLRDVEFAFSGPFLAFDSWSLKALAAEVSFVATGSSPGMNGLSGEVSASSQGGVFEFSASDAKFDWPSVFGQRFVIDRAAGQFSWAASDNRKIEIKLHDGELEDEVTKVWGLNANCEIDTKSRSVFNLGQVFKQDSIADLNYEDGGVVSNSAASLQSLGPLNLSAEANLSVKELSAIDRYFPNDDRIDKFRTWWKNAFLQGSVSNGRISYVGEVSRTALKSGKAKLSASGDFENVEIDYGYQRQWPKLVNAVGSATLDNDLITIVPKLAYLEKDEIIGGEVKISSLFEKTRTLDLHGSMVMNLPKAMSLLFDGPLLKPSQRGRPLPITASKGEVSAALKVSIPLANVTTTTLIGSAKIIGGDLLLPQKVPVRNVNADIQFTERSVTSDNISASFLDGKARAKLITTEQAQPPKMKIRASGSGDLGKLEPWIGEHILSWFDGRADWQGGVAIDGSKVTIDVTSELKGVTVSAPSPLSKPAELGRPFSLLMQLGGNDVQQQLAFEYGDYLQAKFVGDVAFKNSFFDNAVIRLTKKRSLESLKPAAGINYLIDYDQLDFDAWLEAIIDMAKLETAPVEVPNTTFLDAMRSIKISSTAPQLLSRPFGAIEMAALSVDGFNWIGSIDGENVSGSLAAEPRAQIGRYNFNLDKLHIVKSLKPPQKPAAIDKSLKPSAYPKISLKTDSLSLSGKRLGRLSLVGEPVGDIWSLTDFQLSDRGISTTATGQWSNNSQTGSLSNFKIDTIISDAGGVLDDMEFTGLLKSGDGKFNGEITWVGAPHEFDFSRLNGKYDFNIDDGSLVKVQSGSGKVIGLLNSNELLRRLTLDFRDIFSSGLIFDRMRFSGLLANGEAIMRDAYVLTPSVFVQMEGKLDLGKELIDMDIHVSPELGGNLALLSALANPAAGAVVFLTQKIFRDEMRAASTINYRAIGTWKDFEIVEFDKDAPIPTRDQSTARDPKVVDAQ